MSYNFVLFSKQPWMHPTAKVRDIFKNKEFGWNSWSFAWGKRDKEKYLPFYYWKNNGSINFGLSFLKFYCGLRYTIKGALENDWLSKYFGKHVYFIY